MTRPILLDTHVWVWLMLGDNRLGSASRRMLEKAVSDGRLRVSVNECLTSGQERGASMPYDCFISYSSTDIAFAKELNRRLLETREFTVWFDKARLDPGMDWHAEIESGCENSRLCLPVLTPRWGESDWTRFETYGAEAIIPLIVEGAWAEVATPPLERFQAERLDFADASQEIWDRLFAAIRRSLTAPAPEKVARVTSLPYRPNDYFTGRERELVRVHEELHRAPKAGLTRGRVRAIEGLGGTGKTTLVRQYAEKFWRCYPQMFWVDCRLGFEAEFAKIHDLLLPSAAGAGYGDADKAARALQELQGAHSRLLILDNAPDERLVIPWIPKTGGCHTLITSQFAGWSAAVKSIHLWYLERGPSVEFLQRRAGREAEGAELAACALLAEKLGYLPLALEQAASYVAQQGEEFGFSDYLRLYERAPVELLNVGADGATEYPEPVMRTWLAAMSKLSAAARAILTLVSSLAPTGLPLPLITAVAPRVRELAATFAPGATEQVSDDEIFTRAALNDLKRYSLVDFNGRELAVHGLVQLVVRESVPTSERDRWWKGALGILIPAASGHGLGTQLRDAWKPVFPHAEALHATWGALRDVAPSTELAELLRDCYYSLGRYEEALPFAQLVYREDQKQFGEFSQQVEFSLSYLGIIFEKCRRYEAAVASFRHVRQGAAARLGERHPITLRYTQNLAHALEKFGNSAEASTLYQSVLQANPTDDVTLGNYAYFLQNVAGDLAQARLLYERALAVHPKDIINLNNYAGLCLILGDYETTETVLEAAWMIASVRTDRFAARTIFLRLSLALLRAEDPERFLGQIKSVFVSGISPAPSENVSLMSHLHKHLKPEDAGLLEAIYNAINDRDAQERLAQLDEWRRVEVRALELPWHAP